MTEGFDYGADPVGGEGSDFKMPDFGPHVVRLRSIVHLGTYIAEYRGKPKPAAPFVSFVFELKEDADFTEDGIPLDMNKKIALRKGSKAGLTEMMKALDPDEDAKGFDDLIGRTCNLNVEPSDVMDDSGKPKYANAGSVSPISKKFRDAVEPLEIEGVGHVTFEKLTEEAILELHPIVEVHNVLEASVNYPGSKAEEAIKSIREDDSDFAKPKEKEESKNAEGGKDAKKSSKKAEEIPAEKVEDLSDDKEF